MGSGPVKGFNSPEVKLSSCFCFSCMTIALLPRWSPFGDFGPHGDQNEIFGPHLVPILFQSPHFPHFRLKNASKVSAATIYRLDVNHLITCDKQIYSQNFIANTDALKP